MRRRVGLAIATVRRYLSLTVLVALIGFAFAIAGEWQILSLINSRHADALTRENENKEHQHNAALNRAINVETWCLKGFNAGREYDRAFVKKVTSGQVQYTLPNLDCEQIIAITLQSGTQKPHVTPTSNPLVYQALHKK